MILNLITGPATEPVTAALVRQLSMPGVPSTLDSEITAIIPTARQLIEQLSGRALISQTWDRWFDYGFPQVIELPWAPLQSVEITYTDVNGSAQTLNSALYTVDTDSEPGRIYPAFDQCWPGTRCIPKAVKVRYVAGYGDDADDVPEQLRHAVAMMTAELFNNREDSSPVALARVPWGVKALVGSYKMHRRAC
jgi:uncharacterized phiE125 gp8 family phage protein